MVAVVTGTGLGLAGSSAAVLGAGGQLGNAATGRGGAAVYVNAQTGGLIVQHEDELLVGRGPDLGVVRTYNSHATFDFDNGDSWQLSLYRQLSRLTGTVNTAGSRVVRTGADGAQLTYTYDAARGAYVSAAGAGAADTLRYDAATATWSGEDGERRISERYAAGSTAGTWRLTRLTDLDGQALTYAYDAQGLIAAVTDANGETTRLLYDGARRLQGLEVVTADGVSTIRVRYTYDAQGRLASVVTDLTPTDGSISDGATYTTAYAYDGASTRLAAITHGDGTRVAFTYDANGRVARVIDGADQATTFTYGAGRTTVTDPLGQASVLTYDAAGQLTRLQGPAGSGQDLAYAYNARGDLEQLTDSRGNTVTSTYDAHGNLLRQQDGAGNVVERAYNGADQLIRETVYAVPDPDGAGPAQASGPQTTYYVRDARQHLRFTVSPQGRVAETRYNATGQAVASLVYAAGTFAVGASAPAEADLVAWAAAQDKTRVQRTDTAYDARGLVSTVTRYAQTDTTGAGLADGRQAVTRYVYDRAGRLLQQIDPRGVATAGVATDYVTSYAYDGLGRQIRVTATDAAGSAVRQTTTVFHDALNRLEVTLANGLKRVSTFDARGLLMSQVEAAGATPLSTWTYAYDAAGRLAVVTDPKGARTYTLYDSAGRVVGTVDAAGALTETVYNAAGQVTTTRRYANAVSVSLATLFAPNAQGIIPQVRLSSVRPAASASDPVERRIYDAAGRLRFAIDARGFVSETRYDGAGRVLARIAYARGLANAAGLDTLGREAQPGDLLLLATAPAAGQIGLQRDAAADRVSRSFYDADGRLTGTLDGEGTLTAWRYDAAGRLVQTIRYGTPTAAADRAAGAWATLLARANAAPTLNIESFTWYDGLGQVSGELDGEGYVTAYQYDAAGNRTRTTRYARRLAGQASTATPPAIVTRVPATPPAGGYVLTHAQDQTTQATWTAFNQVETETAANGTLTRYAYDSVGHRLRTVIAAGAGDSRTLTDRYDRQGRLLRSLSAVGAQALAALGASPTAAQVEAVWTTYGTSHTYDAAGRRLKTVDANGAVTLFFYDAADRLTYTVVRVKNPANRSEWVGEVRARQYNALGQVTADIGYANRIAAAQYAGLTGGADAQLKAAGVLVADAARDRRTDSTYQLTGELARTTTRLNAGDSAVTSRAYNAFGELSVRTTALDATRTRREEWRYDRRGLVSQVRPDVAWASNPNASGVIERTTYDAFGRAVRTTDGQGVTRTAAYDKLGRQIETVTDPGSGHLNLTRRATYDAFGRVLTQTDALEQTTTTAYAIDAASGRTTLTLTSPEAIVTRTVTDRYGQTVVVADGRGNETRSAYDANGNLLTVKRWDQAAKTETTVETATYDTAGLLLQETRDANGHVVAYTYDAAGRQLTRTVDPAGLALQTRYAYDALGRAVTVTDAAHTVTRTTYDQAGRVVELAVDPSGLNLRTQYAYDLAGNQVTVVEGCGTPAARTTTHAYDSLNRRTRTVVDPAGLNLVTTYAYDLNDNLVTRVEAAGTAAARTTRYSFDAANRLVYTVDALGGVVKQDYDAEGRVLQTTAYAHAVDVAVLADAPSGAAVAALITPDAARDRSTRHAYDRDGRERFTIDALGGVTEQQYDAAGNVTKRLAYARPLQGTLALGSAPAIVATAPTSGAYVLTDPDDRVTGFAYDAFNRLSERTDALDNVTRFTYDAAGRIVATTVAADTAQAVTLRRTYDAAGRVETETRAYGTALAVTTTYGYDALGHQTALTEAAGTEAERTTHQEFDRAGRKTAAIDATGARTTTAYNAVGDIVKVTDALGHSGYFYTDARGRVTLQVDPEGAVTETRYDAFGQTTEVIRYARKVVGAVSENTRPAVLAAAGSGVYVLRNDAADQRQQVLYDRLGRQAEIRTWWGPGAADYYRETFSYDAFGQVLSATARNRATTTYGYDALGHRTREVLPVTSQNASGVATAVEHRFEYDAFGQQVRRTEAWGLPEQRLTRYTYDALGRQTAVIGEALATFDPVTQTDVQVTPTTRKGFDARGNLVEETDARGQRTLHYYDGLDRETGRIDPAGTYTAWTYDAAGHRTRQTTYANAVALAGTATLSAAAAPLVLSAAPLAGNNAVYVLADAADDRTVLYTYDALGRPTGTRIDGMTIGAYAADVGGGQYQVGTGSLTTSTTYDALGQAVKTIDANGHVTRSYYNRAGQQVGELDARRFLVVWTRNAAGQVERETRYAQAVSSALAITDATDLATLVAHVSASADDRVTVTTYDRLNRVRTETKKAVAAGTVSAADGTLTEATSDAVTTYAYNGLDLVTRQTDATGAVTDWAYDGLGRRTREQKPGYTDFLGHGVRPTTDTEYDGLGHVRRTLARGTDAGTEADDRITTFTYGVGGFLTSQTDAAEAVTRYRVDANGNVTKKILVSRRDADGVARNDVTLFQYDALNREVKRTDVATGRTEEVRYNAFGEVTGKRTQGGGADVAWPEFAAYDRAGRVWKSNSGDGVTQVYVRDAAGNATLTVQSTGADLAGQDLATVLARTDTLKTIAVFDARNQLTDTFEPTMDAVHELAAVAAHTTGQAVFVANNSAITIGAQSSLSSISPTTTNPVTSGGIVVTGNLTFGGTRGWTYNDANYSWAVTQDYVLTLSSIPDTSVFGSGNLRFEVTQIAVGGNIKWSTNPQTQSFYSSGAPISVVTETDGNASCVRFLVTTYKALAGGGEIKIADQFEIDQFRSNSAGVFTTSDSWSSATGGFNSLDITGQPTTATRVILAYRPTGSIGAYTLANVPAMKNAAGATIAGWFSMDWSALAGAKYDIQYMAFDASGAVVNKQSGTLDLRNPATPVATQNSGALGGIGGTGRGLTDTSGNLNILEQGNATSLTLKYRIKGSNGAWSTVSLVNASPFGVATPGWFSLSYATYFAAGTTYELDFSAYAGTTLVNRAKGEFSRDASGNPSVSAFTAYSQLPSIVHLTERTDTRYVKVSYRPKGSTGAYTTVTINPTTAGSGKFDWDASALVPVATNNYGYEVVIKAYSDSAGSLVNNVTAAVLRLGADATVVSAQTQALPPVLRVTPAPTGVARIALGYRLKGSSDAYTPLAMTAVGGEFRNDLTGLPPAVSQAVDYEYVYDAYASDGASLGRGTGTFSLPPLTLTLTTGGAGVTVIGNTVTKTSGVNGAWDADAYSPAGLTGAAYVAARAGQANRGGMFGLNADPTANRSYNSLDYAWYTRADGILGIYESGKAVGNFGAYTASDVLAIAYEGSTVRYLKNGQVLRTVSTTAGRTFYFDASFYHIGFTLNAVQFGTPTPTLTARGSLTVSGNTLTKTGADGWDADAYSLTSFTGSAYVSAQAGQTHRHGMFGLNADPTADASYTSLDYAWYPAGDGNLYIYENGVNVASLGPYATTDVLSIVYSGSTITYLKNGKAIRTASTTAGRTFYFDSSFYNTGFTFNALQFGGSVLATVTTGGGAAISGNTVSKGSGTDGAWDSEAYSQTSYTGNAYVSAKAAQTNKGGMFGLNADPTANRSYSSLDYAWYTRADGLLGIYESGKAIGNFGSYTPSDVLAIAYEGSTVRYLKNGQVLRTVSTTAGRTFYFDASFYHTGCTFTAIQFGTTASPSTRLDWVIQNVSTVSSRVHKRQTTNAFGEVVQEIDGLDRVTDLAYNTLGRLVQKQDPQTDVTLANGFVRRERPTTRFVYDLGGRLVATIDPNGATNTQVWLNGGEKDQIILERHADSGRVTQDYDVFGNQRVKVDALRNRTETTYDALDRIIEVRHPLRANGAQAIDRYGYDAAGNRISHTNALDDVEKTYYDSLGRVTKTRSYAGFTVTYAYTYSASIRGAGHLQVGGWQKRTTDAVGRTAIEQQDVFGRTSWRQDQGGHQFTYRYNGAGRLIAQTGTSGQAIVTDYYANGYVKSVWDQATGAYTRYEYDDAGNRTFEGYVTLKDPHDLNAGARDYHQYATLEYDELNRLKRVLDPKADIRYEYDAASNRRRVVSTYHDGVSGAMRVQDYWYVYDAMNRFTVTMGSLSTGARGRSATDSSVTIVAGGTGVAIAYDLAGHRRRAANGTDGTVEQYRYSADGYLEDVTVNGVLHSRRDGDLLGQVRTYTEWNDSGGLAYTRTTTYDRDSRVLKEDSVDRTGAHSVASSTTNLYYTDATDNAATASQGGAGQLAHSTTISTSDGRTTVVDSYTAYEYWDGAQQMAVTAQAYSPQLEDNNAFWRPGYAKHVYDVNGHLVQALDAGADGALGTGDDSSFRYTTDARGQILVRDEIAAGRVNRVQRYYYANNVRVGDVGNDGPSRTDYAQAIAARGVDHKDYRHWQPVAAADFDQNYEPVGPHYPGMTPSSYTVRAGDTLQSIARAAWGDGAMWYLIADANGLTGTEALAAGQVLTLPNKVTNIHNNAGTFRPYNPGEAIGDTSPTIPDAPPPPVDEDDGGGCGGFGGIIVAIVVVVATVYTVGLLTAPAGTTGFGAIMTQGASVLGGAAVGSGNLAATYGLGAVGSLAVGGAVGSIAGQLTGMALGVQDRFSWGAVATCALTTALAPSISPFGKGTDALVLAGNAAVRSVVNQGIQILAGQQKGFSWGSVAASAISAPITHWVTNQLLTEPGMVNGAPARVPTAWAKDHLAGAGLVQAGVGALTSGLARVALQGGRLAWEAVAADALSSFIQSGAPWAVGNASGNSIVEAPAGGGGSGLTLRNGEGIQVNLSGGGNAPIVFESPDYALDGGGMRLATQMGNRFTYTVQAGDTLTSIADANGRQLGELLAVNRLSNPNLIREGQDIIIPAGGVVPPEVSRSIEGQFYRWNAQQEAAANNVIGSDGMRIGPTIERAQAMGIYSGNPATVLGTPFPNSPVLSAWDGVSGTPPTQDQINQQTILGGLTHQMGRSLQDAMLMEGGGIVLGMGGKIGARLLSYEADAGFIAGVRSEAGLVANEAAGTIGRIESRFGNASREVGFVIDSNTGQILTVARQPYGQAGASFRFSPEQWSMAEGNWITHNHPSGNTLGLEDVAGAISSGARGIRASTSAGTFELSFEGAFGAAYRGEYGGAYGFLHAETNAIGRGIMADVRSGALTVPNGATGLQYKGFLANEMWVRYAAQTPGLRYTFTPR